ncbi:STAS domain-containing protein [Streptomyces sp. GQFP]|uniref:STAS domain-containing protein n=1 Tax=Streptomyces sp. GQFP TaxID=2907545 RepID=UPI001F2C3808|nr:STAS domain-containing protein [Streptomyces sp. GQFP]UIX33276.1 STAS domain-containing protein [Streptomyces sp. GQFP]
MPEPEPAPAESALLLCPLPDRAGWRAVGEVTSATCPAWEQALGQSTLRTEIVWHLEMSAVTFVDVAGVSALAMTAQDLPDLPAGRRIVVERPPATLRRLLEMFWPELSVIEVVTR